jgi:flagellar protein FlbD
MIPVTRLDGKPLLVNADLIETIEETPDTIIAFTTGQKLLVRESSQEISQRVLAYKQAVFGRLAEARGPQMSTIPPGELA